MSDDRIYTQADLEAAVSVVRAELTPTCTCPPWHPDMDGPDEDCPQHGRDHADLWRMISVLSTEKQAAESERDKARRDAEHWRTEANNGLDDQIASSDALLEMVAARESAEADLRALREGLEALADEWDQFTDADWFDHTPREHADVLRALLAASPAEGTGEALCDGCDSVTTGVKATDDGRAQMCPACLPVANAPRTEPVWGISRGPSTPVTIHPSEDSARAAAADVTRGGMVVRWQTGDTEWAAPAPRDFAAEHEAARAAQRRALAIEGLTDDVD